MMDSRTITITRAAHKHGNLNIGSCGREFFPEDVFGKSSRQTGTGVPIILRVEGFSKPIKTDIPTDAKSGRPRWLFRERGWVREFVRINELGPEDKVTIKRLSERTYRIQPIYTKVDPPTTPSEVTPATPLQRLNLNWSEKELPEKVWTKHVHRLYPDIGNFVYHGR